MKTHEESIREVLYRLIESEKESYEGLPYEQALLNMSKKAYRTRLIDIETEGMAWAIQSAAECEALLLLEIIRLNKELKEQSVVA